MKSLTYMALLRYDACPCYSLLSHKYANFRDYGDTPHESSLLQRTQARISQKKLDLNYKGRQFRDAVEPHYDIVGELIL